MVRSPSTSDLSKLNLDSIALHIVPGQISNSRLQQYCYELFPQLPSHKSVVKAIKSGHILVNGKCETTGYWVQPGDELKLLDIPRHKKPLRIKLEVVYEDEHLAVVEKPAGLVTSGNRYDTLENALWFNLLPGKLPEEVGILRPVHRLDSLTRGLVLVAKTLNAEVKLKHQFQIGGIGKVYHAIVVGHPPKSGEVDTQLEGKRALTKYKRLYSWEHKFLGSLSFLQIVPETGRTHQIRKHLSRIESPILGDPIYGNNGIKIKRGGLYLHATSLDFKHPFLGSKLNFNLSIPSKFVRLLKFGKYYD